MAHHDSPIKQEEDKIKEMFEQCDKQNIGTIKKEQIQSILAKMHKTETEIDQLLSAKETDDYKFTDFLAVMK